MNVEEDREQLRQLVRGYLRTNCTESHVRATMATDSGFDRPTWRQMAQQLGLQGLAVGERYGGAGAGLDELGVAFEEMGRALLCAPFLSTVGLAATLLLRCDDDDARAAYLPGIAAGETIATVVVDATGLRATRETGSWAVTGSCPQVLDGHVADVVFALADGPHGVGLFAIDAAGISGELIPTLDQTRRLARLTLDGAPATPVHAADPVGVLRATLHRASALLAAEQVGGTARVLEMAVEYAQVREQFGRPIGAFQAIKHKCADMLVELECARTAAQHALVSVSENHDPALTVALAGSVCSQAYVHCAERNIQIHGGIGFTWEHPAHLYYKRAKASEVLFATPGSHRRTIADRFTHSR
jgi:alkylation response protein AidB-like acyl-CoA dehydrogenase